MNTDIKTAIEKIYADNPFKLVLSKTKKASEFEKIVIEKKEDFYQFSKYTKTQVFHENIKEDDAASRTLELTKGVFYQINAFSDGKEHIALISKKEDVMYKVKASELKVKESLDHNRKKEYIIPEGTDCKPLMDMGIFTKDGKVVSSMQDKYRQINRFIEIIDDEVGKHKFEELNIIDFGCGKSYLTFIVYYYLVEIKGIKANIVGLDLKADVIDKCNKAAEKYGYDKLKFFVGDVNGFKAPFDVNMVLTLHACDTATDYALYNAISWKADMIFSVPCCQHELNGQMKPSSLNILSRYGIIQERFSALATDAIRANLLEAEGYKTQLLEFIDLEHTPKNILIRAVRKPVMVKAAREKALSEVVALEKEFGFSQTLHELLKNNE